MMMTYRIAHSLGMDAANQQMRDPDAELPGIEPERCGCAMRTRGTRPAACLGHRMSGWRESGEAVTKLL